MLNQKRRIKKIGKCFKVIFYSETEATSSCQIIWYVFCAFVLFFAIMYMLFFVNSNSTGMKLLADESGKYFKYFLF